MQEIVFKISRLAFVLVGAFLLGYFTHGFVARPPVASADLAAWVQALGSAGAIFAAIWIMRRQNFQDLARDEQEIRQILFSIQDEISDLANTFAGKGGLVLMANPDGPFRYTLPVTENAFAVYTALTGKIGRVNNHDLRKKIISTYASAFAFVRSVQLNNVLLERSLQARLADDQLATDSSKSYRASCEATLADYGPKLRKSYTELRVQIEDLLVDLQLLR